jgi:Flp pilus assembly protein TadD
MGKLMSENKELNDKLAAAEKELQGMKSNPSSRLALAETQLKNLQDEYEESQAANKALQDTTTTLKGQLDQAQSDLAAANQKLASMGPSNSDYATLKHENEMMREILTRELQEQAHRDMAKRLAQEEFDNLKLKSKVLQEQLDILGSPMTPPSDDEEKAFLESLKVSAPQIDGVSGNTFSAPASGTPAAPTTPAATPTAPGTTVAATTPAPAPDTNMASATPPATSPATAPAAPATPPANTLATTAPATPPAAPAMQDTTPGQPPVNIVMNGNGDTSAPPPPSTPAPTPAATPSTTPSTAPADTTGTPAQTPAATPASSTPPPAAPANSSSVATTTPPAAPTDPTVPVPPTGAPLGNSATATTAPATPPSDPNAPTKSVIPPGQTTVTSTTVTHGDAASAAQQNQTDPSVYATQARLPDDMKETAQEAADLFKNQNYDASAAKYQDIIDKYPESLYAWSNLGVVRFQQGKFDDALKALQQAVKLSPTDAFSYSNLGIVYYQLGQYENAIDALNSAKALDPNDAKTHNYLGCACSQKGWQEVAEKEFRKAIEIDPNFGDAHFNLALVYATSKPPSLELARREYNTALSLGIQRDARLEKLLGDTTGATSVGQSAPGQ